MKNRNVIGIHQPNFFPWKGFFEKMRLSDVFVLLDNVDIVLNSSKAITHRTRIKTPNGEKWISLPLVKGESKLINEIICDIDHNWKKKTMELIRHNYKKAENFELIFPMIEELIPVGKHRLSQLNGLIIEGIARYLGIFTPIIYASDMNLSTPDKNGRIIEIVKKLDGTTYLSGNGAKRYNDHELFTLNNIEIDYMNTAFQTYNQLYGEFIPGLGIIDYLFNVNDESFNSFK